MRRSVAAVLLAVALAGCAQKQKPPAPPPPTVSVAQPLEHQAVDWDEYIGRFEAPQSVDMRARINGVVTRILFDDGQLVKAGQPLFIIDPRPYRAALEQAVAQVASNRATLANASSVANRSAKLVQAQAVSREELENDQAQVRTARASLQSSIANADNARLNLSFTTVRAPVTGRVSNRRVSLGDQVTAQNTLLTTIVSTDPIWFTFDGAESFYLKYARDALKGSRPSSRVAPNPIDIQLADESGFPHRGYMSFVDNAIDPNTGTIQAHAVVQNANGMLVPGLFGRARLLGSGRYNAMLIPDEAISTDQTRKLVFVLGRDGKVAQRTVEPGPMIMGLRAIKDGLAPTDLVVIDNVGGLQPGAQVNAKRTQIKPRNNDQGPDALSVTTPPSTAGTFPSQVR